MSDAATGAFDVPHIPEGPHEFRSAERLEGVVELWRDRIGDLEADGRVAVATDGGASA